MRVKITILSVAIVAISVLALWQVMTSTAPDPLKSPEIVRPDQLVWRPFAPGVEIAVVFGHLFKKGGLYVMRIRSKGEDKAPPHWHATDEQITVLEGTFWNGFGEQFDASKLQEMKVGAHATIPAGVRHFTLTKADNVIEQFGEAPFVINKVKPEDDSTKAKSK